MKENIPKLFYSISQDNPDLSSYVCLLKALEGKGMGKRMCEFYFNNLVDEDDYIASDRERLIEDMVRISKPLI